MNTVIRSKLKLTTGLALGSIIGLAAPLYAQTDVGVGYVDDELETGDAGEFPILIAESDTAYIDNAIIGTQFRWRIDAAFDNERPDRAEFFYAQCGCFEGDAPGPTGDAAPGVDPLDATVIENSLDSYEFRLDYEYAFSPKFSVFGELPLRAVDGNFIDNEFGLGDIRAGFKYGLIVDPGQALTFQLRAFLPTGDAEKGLGTDHYTLEPGLLYLKKLSATSTLSAELRYWAPIDGSSAARNAQLDLSGGDYSGDIIRYGVGYSHDIVFNSGLVVTPVVEVVGWSIMGGYSVTSDNGTPRHIDVQDEDGTHIANVKLGLRWQLGGGQSLYMGYGRAVTGQKWYDDVFRLEWRLGV